ncbi:MAG TPA: hypothetical protein VIJ27_03480 [Mucilaginibacter sp.]
MIYKVGDEIKSVNKLVFAGTFQAKFARTPGVEMRCQVLTGEPKDLQIQSPTRLNMIQTWLVKALFFKIYFAKTNNFCSSFS